MVAHDSVSILILAHDKAAYTRRCLDSLLLSTLRPFQVVLVDNGSTDETPDLFADFRRLAQTENIGVEILRLKENVGAVVGRNRALKLLDGAYHVFMDNDTVVRTRSWLEKLRAVLRKDRTAGAVGPKLVYPNPPHDIQCAGCEVTAGGRVLFAGRGAPRTAEKYARQRDCPALISACWMMRGELPRQLGPLDERFSPVQFEDIDYCYRIREAGFSCRYEPAVEMYHFENVTTGRTNSLNYPYLTVKNGLKFKEKWRERLAAEGGPPDSEWKWSEIPTVELASVPRRLPTKP